MKEALYSALEQMGAALVACADISELDKNHGYPRALLALIPLDKGVVARIPTGPHTDYTELYAETNRRLDAIGMAAEEMLKKAGYGAYAVTRDRAPFQNDECVTEFLPHKTVGRLAGIGWIGKCALLVTKRFGAAFRMTVVLTDAPLEPNAPCEENFCGSCNECGKICPGKAVLGVNWTPGMPREAFFDAFACVQMTQERAAGRPEYSVSCGLCIAACPYTRKYLGE